MESWLVAVARSGKRIYAWHSEIFGSKEGSRTSQYLLDADTLQGITVVNTNRAEHWPPEDLDGAWWREIRTAGIAKHDELVSVRGDDSLIAGEIHRRTSNPLDLNLAPKASGILLYSIAKRSKLCSIPLSKPVSGWPSAYLYAVSRSGAVALIQGNTLSLFQPCAEQASI
jgi:hypothetical protein